MSFNFWESNHYKFLTTKEHLQAAHFKDRKCGLTEMDIYCMKNYVIDYLAELSRYSFKLIRQRVIACAIAYLRQFYLVNDFCEYDPRQVGIACVFLACKAEEAQVPVKIIFQIMYKISGWRPQWPVMDMPTLLGLEMVVLDTVHQSLIVYSPYRDLSIFMKDVSLKPLNLYATAAITDSYQSDMCLLYPPFVIAIAAILVAAEMRKVNLQDWLDNQEIDYLLVAQAAADLHSIYQKGMEVMSTEEFNKCMSLLC